MYNLNLPAVQRLNLFIFFKVQIRYIEIGDSEKSMKDIKGTLDKLHKRAKASINFHYIINFLNLKCFQCNLYIPK